MALYFEDIFLIFLFNYTQSLLKSEHGESLRVPLVYELADVEDKREHTWSDWSVFHHVFKM